MEAIARAQRIEELTQLAHKEGLRATLRARQELKKVEPSYDEVVQLYEALRKTLSKLEKEWKHFEQEAHSEDVYRVFPKSGT